MDIHRNTKIIATLGPSSNTEGMVRELIRSGMNIARLNFSHGTHEDHAALIKMIRQLSKEMGSPVGILQDLQGPKIRVGDLPNGPINLTAGMEVTILTHPLLKDDITPAGEAIFPVLLPGLEKALAPGKRILLDDGHLEIEITASRPDRIRGIVRLGGLLSSHKGVNLPGANLDIPGFTDKDREDLIFGLQQKVDMVAISFVRTADDIRLVRHAIRNSAPDRFSTPIIAKLERPEALDNLEEILDAADGVMVARGDLGVEMSPATVPIAQKKIIEQANLHCKSVITATQMLDSMIINPRPTRAEASDVANAVFDGSDAVMLSGESASGKYPLESVQMMGSIVCQAEEHYGDWAHCAIPDTSNNADDALSLSRAASDLAQDRNVTAIAVFTHTGRTALLVSKSRPRVPILAFTPDPDTCQRMTLYWGVRPHLVPFADSMESMIKIVDQSLIESTLVCEGQQIVLISGFPISKMRAPNFALLHTVGEEI
jgi:pyruvate kinase